MMSHKEGIPGRWNSSARVLGQESTPKNRQEVYEAQRELPGETEPYRPCSSLEFTLNVMKSAWKF